MAKLLFLKLFFVCLLTVEIYGFEQDYIDRLQLNGRKLRVSVPLLQRQVRSLDPYTLGVMSSNTFAALQDQLAQNRLTAANFGPNSLGVRVRTPRISSLYNQGSTLIPVRQYRRLVPSSSKSPDSWKTDLYNRGRTDITGDSSIQGNSDQLRFLGWLFGRPNYSPYGPDYSVLEEAAGIGPYGSYGNSRFPSVSHPGSSVMVEDCTEYLDTLTHETIEDCHEVPVHH